MSQTSHRHFDARIILPVLSGLLLATPAHATQEVYNDGAAFANERANAATSNVTSTTAAEQNVPNYTTNPPETSYESMGEGAAGAGATSAQTSESAQSVKSSTQNSKRFTFDTQNDPVFQRSNAIIDDPINAVGGIGSSYSGCTQSNQGSVANPTNQVCREYRANIDYACNRTRNVYVRWEMQQTCTPGSWAAGASAYRLYSEGYRGHDGFLVYAYCNLDRTDNRQAFYLTGESVGGYNFEVPTTPWVPHSGNYYTPDDKVYVRHHGGAYHLYYTGGCDAITENCSYSFYQCASGIAQSCGITCETICYISDGFPYCYEQCDWVCWPIFRCDFRGDINFPRPRTIAISHVTEDWSNTCDAYEARQIPPPTP